MRVGLNLVFLTPGDHGGLETYARELIPALQEAAPGTDFTAFVGRGAAGEDFGVESHVLPVTAASRIQWVLGEQLHLPLAARGCDLVHSLASTAPATGRFARVATIHDLNYLVVPEAHFGARGLGMRVLVPLAARRSDRVISVSEATKRDLVERLHVSPDKIDVVPNGFGRPPGVTPTPGAELRARYDLGERPVILSLSAMRPHKNLAGLIDALALLPVERTPALVVPGYRTSHTDELSAHARRLGVSARFPGWLPPEDVEGLFALGLALVFPSFYEGFGLPVLEAMARGVPVACSDRASLPEVAGEAAVLFDPSDPAAIAAAIEQVLADAEPWVTRGRERVKQFTWRRTAELTLASYERALA
jgi:glycosyltransferase involved in cell wall biosynthesis